MSDDSYDGPQARWLPDGLLSPGASAVVALTLAVLVLTGSNLMVLGTEAIFNEAIQSQGMTEYFATWALGALVPAGVSLYLSRRALVTGAAGWELVLARAAFVLAAIGIFYAVLLMVGAFIHDS